MKRSVDALVAQFHHAVKKMIRVRFVPERTKDGWSGGAESHEASKWLISAYLKVTVGEHPLMDRYLKEPGAAEAYPAAVNRLDDFLAAQKLRPQELSGVNPHYVFPFQVGARVIFDGHEKNGPGIIVGPYPGQKDLFMVRLSDGEVVAGHVDGMKLVGGKRSR